MSAVIWGMIGAGIAALVAGLVLVRSRFAAASGASRILTLGPIFEAVALTIFAAEHFLYPKFVPGVPLQKLTPSWVPAPAMLGYFVGIVLLAAGIGLMVPRFRRIAAAGAGTVLLLLTFFFYVPILITDMGSPLALEGVNYVGDTMLFAATALLVGFTSEPAEQVESATELGAASRIAR